MFNDTVLYNIRYGRTDATDEEVSAGVVGRGGAVGGGGRCEQWRPDASYRGSRPLATSERRCIICWRHRCRVFFCLFLVQCRTERRTALRTHCHARPFPLCS